jgi:hypothetical protein
MTKWKVTYQDTPYAHTYPRVLVIEAATREEAFATAYGHLTECGYAVRTGSDHLKLDGEKVRALGVPSESLHACTMIRAIDPYAVRVTGRVLGEEAGK